MFGFGSSTTGGASNSGGKSSNSIKYGRVIDIILDANHPEYSNRGKSLSINGILFRPLNTSAVEEDDKDLKFAYCGMNTVKDIPLKGEIVEIISQPKDDNDTTLPNPLKLYWNKIIPIWNHVHHNAIPDTKQFPEQESKADFGKYFEESTKVNNLQAFPGDTIFQGRFNQSIRFTGTKYESNELVDSSNNSSPLIILSNGQKEAGSADEPILEDVNEDPSSLYFTSDHIIPLTQANEKRDAFDEEPEKADTYKGSQLLANADRLYFNARDEGAYISAKENIGLNAKVVGIDGEDYVGLDAKKIYLGTTAFEEKEPALKGQTSTDWLEDLVGLLESLANTLATTPPAPPTYIGGLIKEGVKLKAQLPQLKGILKQLHSKKVYIDNK